MKKVTFIHAADLHLDSPMVGLKHLPQAIFERLQESTFTSLKNIVDVAIFKQVDFVLFAGDLFDGEDRSIRAQTRLRKQLERLAQQQISVFIIHGNHDHLGGKWANIAMPSNTYVFPPQFTLKTFSKNDDTKIHLYGFSYPKKHVTERMIDDYQKTEGADFHIGLLHGHLEGNSDHGRYAPFTVNELLEKQFDYWALGHIHKRDQISFEPPIIYPGNIQGRHRKETGDKGCYLVSLTDAGANLEFIPTADCVWSEAEVDASQADSLSELYRICSTSLDEIRRDSIGVLLNLKIKNVALSDDEQKLLENGELLETLQDDEKEQLSFVWPVELTVEKTTTWQRDSLIAEADFYTELFSAIDTYESIDDCLAPLYKNPTIRKHVSLPSLKEKQDMVKAAENRLVELLKKE